MINLSQEIIEQQKDYRNRLAEAIREKTPASEFKKYSGGMGVYPQRLDGDYMVRPRIYSGIVSGPQLKVINTLAKKYSGGLLHLTTRQSFQFHHVDLENTWEIMKALLPEGIITLAAGGNGIRNISCPPLSGVTIDEVFDVTPYVIAATNFILSLDGLKSLPRKYKIAFSNSQKDIGKAKISDLGFIATIKDSQKGFMVYGGGGFGANPALAILLDKFIPVGDILYHILAMKQLFEDHGDRNNRNKARIRYIVRRYGEAEFINLYREYLKKVISEHSLEYSLPVLKYLPPSLDQESDEINDDGKIIIRQKNKGYYAYYLHPANGDIQSEELDKILTMIDESNQRIEVRLSSSQGLYIRNLRSYELKKLNKIYSRRLDQTKVHHSVSCTGASNCKIGRQDSQALLTQILSRLENRLVSDLETLPEIRISGCRNACALHQSTLVGFEGSSIKLDGKTVAAYKVYIGGNIEGVQASIGSEVSTIEADKIPVMVEGFIDLVKSKNYKTLKDLYMKQSSDLIDYIRTFESIQIRR